MIWQGSAASDLFYTIRNHNMRDNTDKTTSSCTEHKFIFTCGIYIMSLNSNDNDT